MEATQRQACEVLCGFCATMLGSSLEEEALRSLRERADLLLEVPFTAVAEQSARALAHILDDAADEEALLLLYHELRQDYAYLFYMVDCSKTSPYESVYRTEDRTMLGPTTLAVRAAYAAQGFCTAGSFEVPDDHIALEFAFLAKLFERGSEEALDAARSFLAEHLLMFAPEYLASVEGAARTPFYRAVAGVAAGTLRALVEALEVDPPVPDEAAGGRAE